MHSRIRDCYRVFLVFICIGMPLQSYAQFKGLGGLGGPGSGNSTPVHMEVTGVISVSQDGKSTALVVTANIADDHKTYSITQGPGGPVRTVIKIDKSSEYAVGDFTAVDEPSSYLSEVFENVIVEEHTGQVSWVAPVRLAEGVSLEKLEIAGKVYAQICDASNCFPPKDFKFTAKVGTTSVKLPKLIAPQTTKSNLPPLTSPSKSNIQAEPSIENLAPPMVNDGNPQSEAPPGIELTSNSVPSLDYDLQQLQTQIRSGSSSLPLMIGAAFLAGFILNFMPCVLPVIGLKILSFIEQGSGNPRRILALNIWYSLGILAVFWVLAALAIFVRGKGDTFGWGSQYSNDTFNIVLVSIVFTMALSFLGVWEIPIPGFASSRNAQKLASKEGALGAFVKGLITTLLATPCSGPFLGTAVGFALVSPSPVVYIIFTSMGLGMAAPYLFIGARPSLMRFLPKPGAWMDTFKQVMGFVLLATVLWLMVSVRQRLMMPTLILLTGLAAACWWVGRTPGYAEIGAKLKAWGQALAIAGLVGWLAFAMPKFNDPLPWKNFSMENFAKDVNSDKTVLVEFTAKWCATCKTLKATILDRSKTKSAVNQNGVVVYEADIDEMSEQEFEFFTKMQPTKAVPLIAIFPAGKKYSPISFGNGYTQSQILEALKDAGPSFSAN